ncbi:MAG: hypothetical protein WCI57_03645 [Candidatus Berkelbacteria bacterium]
MFDDKGGIDENEVSKFALQQAFDKFKATIAKDLPDEEISEAVTELWDKCAAESEKNEKSDWDFLKLLIDTLKFIRDNNPSKFDLFREVFDNESIIAIVDNLPGARLELDDDPEKIKEAQALDDEIDLLLNEIEIINAGE